MSDHDKERSRTTRKILDAIDDARHAYAEYQADRMMAAIQGQDPEQDPKALQAKVELHVATMEAYKLLRPQLREHLNPEFWKEVVIYKDEQGRLVRGFKTLERLQDRVFRRQETKETTHKGPQEYTEYDVALLPGEFYDRAIDLMGDAVLHLGYVAPPDPPEIIHDINDPGPDMDLPEGVPASPRAKEREDDGEQAVADGGES